jgi:hypothetical protein
MAMFLPIHIISYSTQAVGVLHGISKTDCVIAYKYLVGV